MTENLKCFLSYAHVDKDYVRSEIVPVLNELGLIVWIDYEQMPLGGSISDAIIKGIREAHIVIAVLNRRSTFVNFEIGAALGQSKPTLAILRDEDVPSDLKNLSYLKWLGADDREFQYRLGMAIKAILDNPINESVFQAAETKRVIGVSIGRGNIDIEQQLRFTVDFLAQIQEIVGTRDIALVQTQKGSFSSFFSLDLKSWAELIEKIIFFIPEWKKKKAENLKILSEVRKIDAETKQIEQDTEIKQANDMLDLFTRYQALGIKIQMGDEILLTVNKNGLIDVDKPKRLGRP